MQDTSRQEAAVLGSQVSLKALVCAYMEQSVQLKAHVVAGLSGTVAGLIYALEEGVCAGLAGAEFIFSLLWVLLLYGVYRLIRELPAYSVVDACIFVIASNTRAVKSIVGQVDARASSGTKKGPGGCSAWLQAPGSWSLILPSISKKPISFERSYEEIMWRLVALATIQKCIEHPAAFKTSFLQGGIISLCGYWIRVLEYGVKKESRPGEVSRRVYTHYRNFLLVWVCFEQR
ncbi:hypothetical protein NEDG_01035 [Nematocida displodere]|uniref:Uncharacterized protein n=1 Tax=Nematocida displodere TaxID=1805483 RepID=A0A177EAZ4_9MICR|nr:hypothetical protein NEDG_01035 [Nematocida displodere]